MSPRSNVQSPESEVVSSVECRVSSEWQHARSGMKFHVSRFTRQTQSAEHGTRNTEHGVSSHAFTLLELMIVVGIMGIVLTMGVPLVYRLRHEAPLRKGVKDVVEVCSYARALAILQSKAVC